MTVHARVLLRLVLVIAALSATMTPAEARPLRQLLSFSSGRSLLGGLLNSIVSNSLVSTGGGDVAAAEAAHAASDARAGVASTVHGMLGTSAAAGTTPSGLQLRSAVAAAATTAAAALVQNTQLDSQASTLAALQATAAAVSALSLEKTGLNLVGCYDAGMAAASPLQVVGVGQTLTISTSALIASSLCGAVHGAGVPFSTPAGTGLCYSASANAVQKAAGAGNPSHFVLNNGPGMEGGLYDQVESSLQVAAGRAVNPFNYPAC